MSNIASKNLYDLLGNDPEQDPDRAPDPPTKVADKPAARTGKRNAGADAPAAEPQRGGRGGRGGRSDRGDSAGALNNRSEQPREDGNRQDRRPRGERGGRRGDRTRAEAGRGYGGRFTRTNRDDRQSHSGVGEHDKQAEKGWGEQTGQGEWNDEVAGEAIAQAESNDQPGFTPDTGAADPAFSNGPAAAGEVVDEDAAPVEPEDKTKSYDQYMAELAEKRLALGDSGPSIRKANEGSKQKFPDSEAFARNAEEENFFIGRGGKAKRERVQQKKDTVDLDGQYYAPPDAGDRGGRGRGRGGRGRGEGRGEFRGDRGDRGGRGGRGRGEFRGDRGDRGEFRGNRGASRGGAGFNANDSNAFPALGGS